MIGNDFRMYMHACKRFVPSEFGNEVDRGSPLPPFEAIAEKKRKIRRAAENSGIPYTFVSSNSMGAYFVNFFLHPYDEKNNKVTVYGTGEAKCKSVIIFILIAIQILCIVDIYVFQEYIFVSSNSN